MFQDSFQLSLLLVVRCIYQIAALAQSLHCISKYICLCGADTVFIWRDVRKKSQVTLDFMSNCPFFLRGKQEQFAWRTLGSITCDVGFFHAPLHMDDLKSSLTACVYIFYLSKSMHHRVNLWQNFAFAQNPFVSPRVIVRSNRKTSPGQQ